jgi:hypothetical protein
VDVAWSRSLLGGRRAWLWSCKISLCASHPLRHVVRPVVCPAVSAVEDDGADLVEGLDVARLFRPGQHQEQATDGELDFAGLF